MINKNRRTLCILDFKRSFILDFKRSFDKNEDFLRGKEDETNKKHKSIIEALKAAAPE